MYYFSFSLNFWSLKDYFNCHLSSKVKVPPLYLIKIVDSKKITIRIHILRKEIRLFVDMYFSYK
jgi:hypothetical protein